MKTIPLTRGKVALVDDADFEWLQQWKWRTLKAAGNGIERWYAITGQRKNTLSMHRVIMARYRSIDGLEFDHRDCNGLNNQRDNLRECTQKQNVGNSRKRLRSSSKFKGVYWHKGTSKWMARIKNKYLGIFHNEEEAARVYDDAAKATFGEFARVNFA